MMTDEFVPDEKKGDKPARFTKKHFRHSTQKYF